MHSWKRYLIESYRWVTLPYRFLQATHFRRQECYPIAVLAYQRVADHPITDWTLTRAQFIRQIDWIAKRFEFISLSEAQRRISSGTSVRPAVCITFNDGYAENNRDALPLLIRRQIPVTYFVSLDQMVFDKPFPHDEAIGLDLPRNHIASLRDLAHCGIEIGAQTRTHCDFATTMTDERVFDEIVTATAELSELIDQEVRYLAIPYGKPAQFDPRVIRYARANGLRGVCSAYGGFNCMGDDSFHLRRLPGVPQMARMKNWLSWEPQQIYRSTKSWLERRLQESIDSAGVNAAPEPLTEPNDSRHAISGN